jgi:alkylation response protein AidB-like acyl-CoA dehydrogenase
MTVLDEEALGMLAAAAQGELARTWGQATSAGAVDAQARLAALGARAAAQGWTALAGEGLLGALVVLEKVCGAAACPLPVGDAFVASMALEANQGALEDIASGAWRVALCFEAGGEVLAEGAAGATHVLVLPRDSGGRARLVALQRSSALPGMAMPPWHRLVLGASVAEAELTSAQADACRAVARLGLAARALGAARRAQDLALEHAKSRVQFGRLIGSYQAVSHRLVDAEIALRSASLLLDEAVRAFEADDEQFLLCAELAVATVREGAPFVQLAAHHTLAAVGYFEEHEAPWLFRRVHADVAMLEAFPLDAGGVGDQLVESGCGLPEPDLGPAARAFRQELRALLERLDDGTWRSAWREEDDPAVLAALAKERLLALTWPKEVGGRDASSEEAFILGEEVAYHRVPVAQALNAIGMIGGALLRHGSDDQRARFLPLFAEGKIRFYLGYSEPEVGSDLARLQTRAVRDKDEWVITGRKMWGTGAHRAEWAWVAARTDPDANPPHAGITVFFLPTGLPGWEAQQHRSLGGSISCSTFFDEVRVPDAARVGEVNGGWEVITSALAGERAVLAGATASTMRHLDDLLAALRSGVADPGPRGSAVRARIGTFASRLQAARLLSLASVRAVTRGAGSRLEAPMAKIASTTLNEELFSLALEILGPSAALGAPAPGVAGEGELEHAHRHSLMQTIGGGTRDIQRNLVARGLGLPR